MPSLADLEKRIRALEAAGAAPETAADTYMVLAPDGTVIFDFAGHVHAKGLDLSLPIGATEVPSEDAVRWLRDSDGNVGASIGAFQTPGLAHDLLLTAYALAGKLAISQPEVRDSAGNVLAALQLSGTDGGGAAISATAVGAGTRTVVDSAGKSSFAQLAAGANVARFGFGQQTLTWPGGQLQSNTLTFNHGLGFTPSYVFANSHSQTSAGLDFVVDYIDESATQISLGAIAQIFNPPAGDTGLVRWLAIG